MQYRTLGATGIKVSTYCLGAMMFGAWGNTDHDDCARIISSALDAGINFVDTADVYSAGESEEIVGKAISSRRDEVVLATKFHGQMGSGLNSSGNSRRWIISEVEASLRRLGTDHIDLYQVHRPDPTTDISETLSALSDLIHQGKVLSIGSSTFPGEAIVEAQWASERKGLERFTCEQPPYSLLVRGIERSILPTCQRYNMGVIVWSPLAGGWLTGKYRRADDVDLAQGRPGRMPSRFDPSIPGNRAKLDIVSALADVSDDAGLSLTHMAMAFSLTHPGVTSAIIGPRTQTQLDDLIAGADVGLSSDVLDKIDAIVAPGVNVNAQDAGWEPSSLTDVNLRRQRTTSE